MEKTLVFNLCIHVFILVCIQFPFISDIFHEFINLLRFSFANPAVLFIFVTDLLELNIGFLELLEYFVLRHEGLVVVHDLLHFLLRAVLDGPVLQFGLGESQEGDNAALVLQELELHGSHVSLGPDGLQAAVNGFNLVPWYLVDQCRVSHRIDELFLDGLRVLEE